MGSNNKSIFFEPRTSVEQIEEGTSLAPKFNNDGLIPVTTSEWGSGIVLMMGFMNNDALILTIESGFAHYWSRSRKKIWKKGETSGMYQTVKDLRIDDDQDAVWMQVELAGDQASCHVGYKSCFYRAIPIGKGPVKLEFKETEKVFDPEATYGDLPNPTKL